MASRKPEPAPSTGRDQRRARAMTEPRARAARHKGQQNFATDLKALLYAFGDDREPLPETVKVLDEIVTDYIIETCHEAALSASYSRRQKIKVDDFKFALRKDPKKLGRVQELLSMDKELKAARRQFDEKDDQLEAARAEAKEKEKEKERAEKEGEKEKAGGGAKGKEGTGVGK
ncbi:MAG: hypothetical protein M1819_001986 [Sarea resinae]|nr:MAG: hypothetical protein M1819_001986 [Sarea resinae]